jgi:hypothetical protein
MTITMTMTFIPEGGPAHPGAHLRNCNRSRHVEVRQTLVKSVVAASTMEHNYSI